MTSTRTGTSSRAADATSATIAAAAGTRYVAPGSTASASAARSAAPGASVASAPITDPTGNSIGSESAPLTLTRAPGSATTMGVPRAAIDASDASVTFRSAKNAAADEGASSSSSPRSRVRSADAGASTSASVSVARHVADASSSDVFGEVASDAMPHARRAIEGRSSLSASNRPDPSPAHAHPRARAARSAAQQSVISNAETFASRRAEAHASAAYATYSSQLINSYARVVSPSTSQNSRDRSPSTPSSSNSYRTSASYAESVAPQSSGRRGAAPGGARTRHAASSSTSATGRTSGTSGFSANVAGSSNVDSITSGHAPVSANPHPSGANPTSRRRKVSRAASFFSSVSAKVSAHRHRDWLSCAAAAQQGA